MTCSVPALSVVALLTCAISVEAQVTAVPSELNLASFYAKHISANGYPIVGSKNVSDYALQEAAFLINLMLAERPDVREAMVRHGSRLVVMAHNEFTTDVPNTLTFALRTIGTLGPADWEEQPGNPFAHVGPRTFCATRATLIMPKTS